MLQVLSNRKQIDGIDIRMARSGLGYSVRELSGISGVPAKTISRIENGYPTQPATITAVKVALECYGAAFLTNGSVVVSRKAIRTRLPEAV